ncbi:MAG: hypothetical protein QOF04_679 [Solirubrobacteraceae bacterium]|jgi:hypothetical protein|nr:hypothetical protein [Solirubrobacteraceae bacterium]
MLTPSKPRIAAFLAAAAATLAVAPAAHAADAPVNGTIVESTLDIAPPSPVSFSTTITGLDTTSKADVGSWRVNDKRGTGAGYTVNIAATAPTIAGAAPASPAKFTVDLVKADTPTQPGHADTEGPTLDAAASQSVLGTGWQVASVVKDSGLGMGEWTFAQGADDLELGIAANAKKGAYSTTLAFTVSAHPAV